ncbi:MAG: methylated-DNA-[protein]-cysteine S-methyltransferase [Cycloclasticus sp.]|jgi:methylated-DNA-[protein]-cysteine S-methyltransferase
MRERIDHRIQTALNADYVEASCDVLDETARQLDSYFALKRQQFDLPLMMSGSAFQQTVWQALLLIPYGTTTSYLDLAEKMGNKQAVRAVASANGANAISIIIPCHRVIANNGQLSGYAGGTDAKESLIRLEQQKALR